MKIMLSVVFIVLLVGGIGGCGVVNSNQALDNKANENPVPKEKEEVWTHFAH